LDWDITPATTLSVAFSSQDTKTKALTLGLPAYGAPTYGFLDVSRSTNLAAKWSRYKGTIQDTAAELTHRFDNGWSATAKFFHRESDNDSHIGRPAATVSSATETLTYTTYQTDDTHKRDALDLYVTGPFRLFGQEHRFLLGYNNDRARARNKYVYGPYPANIPVGRPDLVPDFDAPAYTNDSENDARQSGYYGQLRLRLADPLTVIAGARVSDYRYRSRTLLPAATSWVKRTDEVDDEVTPYAGAVFDVSKEISLYASYSDLFIPLQGEKFGGGFLEPNVGKQYEIGGKGEFFGGRLIASLAYFDIKDKNRAFEDPDHPGFSLNAGEAERKGWELEVSGSPAPGWNLQAGYTHLKTRYLKDSDPRNLAVGDLNWLNNTDPEHLFKFWSTYSFRGGLLDGLAAGLGATYQSKITTAASASAAAPIASRRARTQDAYTVVDAFVSYRLDKNLSLSLNINNLFDKTYYARIGPRGGGSANIFYGEPRNFLLTLRAAY
jgi:outer membrane receptor for ferric coprogen and ferric-rhodotorulic acid